ncbi:MAG: bifunctional 5,10-methylenetetrahydrofolate dehydrogenase/5,10-methenyltetrahydrofolate cyclohydrolase [Candidatus Omnitrophica bacterium]|nr:bifunctional 5,10-methylenetetrahydrofolate dehydrogenase/5,10-methenyltetrahydrofolate cyclohydrolase [Candidatus Omnitrophota bacterium]
MPKKIIDGRKIARNINSSLKREIDAIKKRQKKTLKLVSLQIGANTSSRIYLNSQKKLAGELGIKYISRILPKNTSQESTEKEIRRLNSDGSVTGIIVQTPTPKHINLKKLFAGIAPEKDVEGLNPASLGRLIWAEWDIAPCTANACMAIIGSIVKDLRGKEVVIVGHSEIVGKPLSMMLLSRFATTTVSHIGTFEKGLLRSHVGRAEILVVSVGKSNLIKGAWIRKGAIVIDVGINRVRGKITGDVEFEQAAKRASYITPVPGGVGPVTASMLMKNLLMLYKKSKRVKR